MQNKLLVKANNLTLVNTYLHGALKQEELLAFRLVQIGRLKSRGNIFFLQKVEEIFVTIWANMENDTFK